MALPCEHSSLTLTRIFDEEACGILRMTRRMMTCYLDILANFKRVFVVDLWKVTYEKMRMIYS